MDKQQFMTHVEHAYDTKEIGPENVFLFKFLQFEFSYDDENKTCTITCPVTEPMLNPAGIIHGGILTYLADTAMGHLNGRTKDVPYVTLEMKTSFLKASNTGNLTATARYIRDGYKVCFMECEIINEQGELMSVTNGTFYRFEK
ncbi:PaaI family thioesterase [Pueribacillus sp. YX66]|uniref:PaaI family thioesterase n=1 Tax=Pueribacillus sp. YX66 TaxID=3229242 RepID=UPI00358D15E1